MESVSARIVRTSRLAAIRRAFDSSQPVPCWPGLEVASESRPHQELGGDLMVFLEEPDGTRDVVIADVSGKGLEAHLIAQELRSRLLGATIGLQGSRSPTPEQVVGELNRQLTPALLDLGAFVPLQYLRFHPGRLQVLDAGHAGGLWWPRGAIAPIPLREVRRGAFNLPLGIESDCSYESFDIPLTDGGVALLFSDGISEAVSPDGELFGIHRIGQVLDRYCTAPLTQLIDAVFASALAHAGGELSDDATCLAVRAPSSRY